SSHAATIQFSSHTTPADQFAAYYAAVYGWMTNALKWLNIQPLNEALAYVPVGVLGAFDLISWVPPFAYDVVQAKAAHRSGQGSAPLPGPGTTAPLGSRQPGTGALLSPSAPLPRSQPTPRSGRDGVSDSSAAVGPAPSDQSGPLSIPGSAPGTPSSAPVPVLDAAAPPVGAAATDSTAGFDGVRAAEVAAGLLGAGAVAAVVAQQVRHRARARAADSGADSVASTEGD
ncbi:MAG: hypothetical protein ABJA89_10340, partial [Lapillicoccus sp.]